MNGGSLDYLELFGHDSESEDASEIQSRKTATQRNDLNPGLARPKATQGLQLIPDFFSVVEHDILISDLTAHYPHLIPSSAGYVNQAMYFPTHRNAPLPSWLSSIGGKVQTSFTYPCNQVQPPNHVIANIYSPGDGLLPHVDLEKFADGVAVLSLQSTLVMDLISRDYVEKQCLTTDKFFRPIDLSDMIKDPSSIKVDQAENEDIPILFDTPNNIHWVSPHWARLLLTPGSALILEHDARWEWTHGIRSTDVELWPVNTELTNWVRFPRKSRMSITIRHLNQN